MNTYDFSSVKSKNEDKWFGWCSEHSSNRYDESRKVIEEAFEQELITTTLPSHIPAYQDGKSARLWLPVRKVLGQDTINYAQLEGSCVAFGKKNGIEYTSCTEIAAGQREKFHYVFPPFLYGIGRVYIGKNRLRGQDGSMGSWQMLATNQYGYLVNDPPSGIMIPKYGQDRGLCRRWGNSDKEWKQYLPEAQPHIVDKVIEIESLEDLARMLSSGYACTIASSQGFTSRPNSKGLHTPSGTWHHQMCIVGIIFFMNEVYLVILNSWGDLHGEVRDPETDVLLPKGCLLVRYDSRIDNMVVRGECFPVTNVRGYPDNSKVIETYNFMSI